MNEGRIVAAGDAALVVELPPRIDVEINARAVAIAEAIQLAAIPGVQDVVPTFHTVGVYYDPLRTDIAALTTHLERCVASYVGPARRSSEQSGAKAVRSGASVFRIPVEYGGSAGPDLTAVAAAAGMSEQDVVDLHSGTAYRVFMLGFLPGFAYMGVVDSRLALPRRSAPRPRVGAGSVGVAGQLTGIYPVDSPGGWHLIGRTTVQPFDPASATPCLLKAGDTVQFYPVDRASADVGRVESDVEGAACPPFA